MQRHATVLVVSQQASLRRLVCRILSGEGFRCFEADSGYEALEVLWLVAAGRIELVIVDLDMQDLDAPALVRASRERWPSQSVLYLVGGPMPLSDEDFSSRGTHVLIKPFNRQQLFGGVEAALERRLVRASPS
jgi:two-component system cell cycle sensor histidine kinase/response regulator CckA